MCAQPSDVRSGQYVYTWLHCCRCTKYPLWDGTTSLLLPEQAQAIPAFARKYDVNCTACHTAPPILNQFGQ
jgi:hypothetical protein